MFKGIGLISLKTRELTLVIVFSALAIALEPVRIPVFFWPGQYFHFWEIPAIIAFFLYDFKVGFAVSVLGSIGYAFIFSDSLGFLGPAWRIIVLSTILLGLSIAKKVINQKQQEIKLSPEKRWASPAVTFTVLAVLTRVAIMPFVDISVYRFLFPYFIGRTFSDVYLVGLVPAVILFNFALALFSVPVAYLTSKRINAVMKINNSL